VVGGYRNFWSVGSELGVLDHLDDHGDWPDSPTRAAIKRLHTKILVTVQ
jgi:hypothetical protein